MPRGRRERRVARERPVRGHARLERHVLVGRPPVGDVGQGLELVVGLAGEVDLGVAVVGQVVAGDAHAEDAQPLPPLIASPEARRRTGLDPPELLLPVAVVVAVVRDPQVAPTGSVPVAEQHRERAPSGRERHRRRVAVALRIGPDELVVVALERLLAVVVEDEVVADRQRRQRRVALPGGAECRGPRVAPVEAQRLVGPLEATVAQSAKDHVLADAQHDEVGVAVTVHVERVCPGDVGQVRDGVGPGTEAQRAAGRALVAVERCRLGAPGEVEVGTRVVVAVERRHPAADEEGELPVVAVLDAGGRRLLHEAGRIERRGGRRGAEAARNPTPLREPTAAASTTSTDPATTRPRRRRDLNERAAPSRPPRRAAR